MDEARRWSLEMLGPYGPQIRQQIARFVIAEHEASADAQDASGHRSTGVYGQFWRGILEKFEEFGSLPGSALVRPDDAPYKIPVVNGIAIFPWRFGKTKGADLTSTPFGTSDTRVSIANIRPPAIQGTLDVGIQVPDLTEEERELLQKIESLTQDPVVATGRLILVAISSSIRGLHSVEWGEVTLDGDGYLTWASGHESLLAAPVTKPVSTSPQTTFTSGDVPRKFPPAAQPDRSVESDD